MKKSFTCPHCQGVLNPNVKILLVAAGKKHRGLILLSPQPGNYRILHDASLAKTFAVGAKIALSCPLCSEDLTVKGKPDFAELLIQMPGHAPRRVEFSRVFGTHATFIVDAAEVHAYGENADDFDSPNFFGA